MSWNIQGVRDVRVRRVFGEEAFWRFGESPIAFHRQLPWWLSEQRNRVQFLERKRGTRKWLIMFQMRS
jgi:hypothetical protein